MSKSQIVHVNLRLPPELHKRLIAAADIMNPPLSLNRTIISILDDALNQYEEMAARASAAGKTMPKFTPDDMAHLETMFSQWWEKKTGEKLK